MDMEKEKTDNIENQTPAPEESPVNPHPEEKERDRKKRKIAEQAEKIREQEEKIKKMTEETERLKEAVADARDQYIRLQAEWDNYRRRTAKERLELIDNAVTS